MADDIPALVQGGAFTAVVGAIGLWIANRAMGKAAVQASLNAGFEKLYAELHAQNKDLKRELNAERVAHAATRARLDGDVANLRQAMRSLENHLRRQGIPMPADYVPFTADSPPSSFITVLEQGPVGDEDT